MPPFYPMERGPHPAWEPGEMGEELEWGRKLDPLPWSLVFPLLQRLLRDRVRLGLT